MAVWNQRLAATAMPCTAAIELLAEGMTLADATGLPRDLLLQFLHLMLPGARGSCGI
jgi:hypothetical protein